MKPTALILLLTVLLTLVEVPVQAFAPLPSKSTTEVITAKEEAIFKRKRKGYRRKRGFLWGLFRKKDCGCPKH